jgi:hypothetical protein
MVVGCDNSCCANYALLYCNVLLLKNVVCDVLFAVIMVIMNVVIMYQVSHSRL